ncbi:hypothetical protein GR160_10445 [Flavobacterium sp. Sd200]|uniref:hypothetical protein n=1 Tax=Flavobacterium sp. Sd200 TaxID=2692211 RepID=UPI001369FF7A|nr:hypothetical protein [Flavobacterium sp. Sd200]MXN91646.1 hypothetical protein [Flavobacterium sp. Sd200]
MKLKTHYAFLLLSLFLSTAAFAQYGRGWDTTGGSDRYSSRQRGKGEQKDFVEQTVEYFTKELKLDDFQKAAVRTIIEEQRDPINELMAAKDITNDERRDRGKIINDRIEEKMKPILSPDQLKKFTEIQGKRKF